MYKTDSFISADEIKEIVGISKSKAYSLIQELNKVLIGHEFEASPRLVLEGGHWCPECERKSWNYGKRAQVDPFFAQVWNPLHEADEMREYPKEVSELDV